MGGAPFPQVDEVGDLPSGKAFPSGVGLCYGEGSGHISHPYLLHPLLEMLGSFSDLLVRTWSGFWRKHPRRCWGPPTTVAPRNSSLSCWFALGLSQFIRVSISVSTSSVLQRHLLQVSSSQVCFSVVD